MKKIKKISCFICCGFVCIMMIFGFHVSRKSKSVSANDSVIPISRIQGCFVINVDDPREMAAFSDYVFVGEVLKNEGYEYWNSNPYTNYTVRVLENIKGNLIMDKEIPIVKQGGLSKDGSYYEIFEDDELPVEKGIYIFYADAQADGSLLASGPNSSIKIDAPVNSSSGSEVPSGANQNEEFIVGNGNETPEDMNQNDEFVVESGTETPEGTNQNDELVVSSGSDTSEGTDQNEKFAAVNEKEEFFRNTDIYKEAVDAANHQDDVEVMEVERYTSIYEADSQ
ncbi:MAG: hypothetical protein HFH59_06995 [Lachnospiraceae bacterium]|nr:hypothetical protein [Lachnospiraceae bacterium]